MGKGRLLLPGVTQEQAREISTRNLSEPLAAAITIPFAFVGSLWWGLSWLVYPAIVYLNRRMKRASSR